jgi:hypothetical protein
MIEVFGLVANGAPPGEIDLFVFRLIAGIFALHGYKLLFKRNNKAIDLAIDFNYSFC